MYTTINPKRYRVVANGSRLLPYPATHQWNTFFAMKEKELADRDAKRPPQLRGDEYEQSVQCD